MPNLPDQESQDKMMPGDAASVLGVSTRTLTTMSELSPIILPSGHRRYLRAEVEAIADRKAVLTGARGNLPTTKALADSNETAGARGGDAA